MKNTNDEKQLDEIISRATDLGKVEFDSYKWKEKYLTDDSVNTSHSNIKTKQHKNIWRLIMENKITRYSAAAVVTLAAVLILVNPFGSSQYSSVVLADVQQNVADIETMIIRGTKTYMRPGEPNCVLEFGGLKWHFDLVKFFSEQYGLVEEGYIGDELIYRITMNRPLRQTLLVLPPWKKYGKFTSTDTQMKLLENGTPKGIVNLLLECDYRKLEKENIDGIETEVFEFQDPGTFRELLPKPLFDIQSLKGKVWIGIDEQLPIWVEGDFVIGKCFMTMFNDLILHEFNVLEKCNVELDEDIFDTNPPEGYTELTFSDILKMIPAEAKAGAAAIGIIPACFVLWRRQRRKKVRAK